MVRILIIALLIALPLGCGALTRTTAPDSSALTTSESSTEVAAYPPVGPFYGDTSIEQKILNSDVIVRATMTSLSSEIFTDPNSKYGVALKFNLSVIEYLNGTGASSITAVWVYSHSFDTRSEAENINAIVLGNRDAQWDDREAVIFLYNNGTGFGALLDEQLQRADHFLISVEDPYSPDDRYSLYSERDKKWLPATSGSSVSDASSAHTNPGFLLDIPSTTVGASATKSSSTAPTVTLNDLKKRVNDITTEFNGGDGSEAYKQCVIGKYDLEQAARYFQELDGRKPYHDTMVASALGSGKPANTVLHTRNLYGVYPDTKAKTWFEGTNNSLFSVLQGDATSQKDVDGDGKFTSGIDGIEYTETFRTTRPLPSGVYKVVRKEIWARFRPCNYVVDNDWTVTVTAPVGTIHEAFFDPAKLTGGIGADKDNGVLKPTAFSVNGTAANIERIQWKPRGILEMDLKPGVNLRGHIIEFIGLNGKAFLSLSFSRSLGTSDRPSWQVCDQPWKAGDLLMVRLSAGASAFGKTIPKTPCPQAATPTPTSKPKATPTPTAPPRRK